MDILNFISWIRGGRVVSSVDPNKTLIPVGLKDGRRDDDYLAGAISVTDFTTQVGNTVRPYKVFTALLTQSGGDNPDIIGGNGGTLDVGYTFEIISNPDNYDLTIYGAPNNNAGTKFMCTKSVLNLPYTNSLQIGVNYGAPFATVLENTIGNIWFSYQDVGNYVVNSNELFITDKTYIVFGGFYGSENWVNNYGNSSVIELIGSNNGVLANTPIEIRVYN